MIDQFESTNEAPMQAALSQAQVRDTLLLAFQALSQLSPSKTELTRSHQTISEMMKQELFLPTCLALLQELQENRAHPNAAKLVVTTLSTYLKHQQSGSRLVLRIDRHILNNALVKFFFRRGVQEELRQLLVKSYTQFIYSPGMETIRTQTVDLLCNNFGLMTIRIKHDISNGVALEQALLGDAISYLMVGRAISKGPIEHHQQKSIVKTFLPIIQILAKHFLTHLDAAIQQKQEQQFIHLSGLCDKLIEFWRELVVGTSKDALSLVKISIMKDPFLTEIIKLTLSLALPPHRSTPTHPIPQLVLDAQGNKFLDRINQMKKNCAAVVSHMAKLCLQAQGNIKELEKQEYQQPLLICEYFLQAVPPAIIREFEQLQYPRKVLPHAGLYRVAITALSYIVRIHRFFQESFRIRSKLFYGLCLPLLQRKEEEQYTSAQEFKGRREDILNMHCQDIPQNAACKLIEAYVDKVDGSITVFSSEIKHMIEFHLTASPAAFAQLPPELTEGTFFRETEYQVQVECGLMVMTLLSYLSIGREELVATVESLLVARRQFFFSPARTGMFKAAVLLTYSYYVDNFYSLLKDNKSLHRAFHIEVLQHCCSFIEEFTSSCKIEEQRRGEHLQLEVAALQSLDCISNCITQRLFLPALFQTGQQGVEGHEGLQGKVVDPAFYSLFSFLLRLLSSSLNVQAIDLLIEFLVQTIRSQCTKGHAIKRFHYQYSGVPMAIRVDVCGLICESVLGVYGAAVPHSQLMRSKITTLLVTVLSCCEFPEQVMSSEFFALPVDEKGVWEVADVIDIFLRRMVVYQQQNRTVGDAVLQQVLLSATNLLPIALQDYKMHSLFGILVNLIVLKPELVEQLAPAITSTLLNLLREEDQSGNYEEDLEMMIEKMAYINLIAINSCFTPRCQPAWCALTEAVQRFLASRSTKGIIAARSIPYIGKLLAIALVCLARMRQTGSLQQSEQSRYLWNNILRTADVYATTAEKQMVASVLIGLMDDRQRVDENDEECKRCYSLVSHLLYKAYSKLPTHIEEDYGDDRESSSVDSGSEGDETEDAQHLHYREYSIAHNEFSRREKKDKYITAFKKLCHRLKETSPQFLKTVVEALPLPINNFVKSKVFYYQSVVSSESPSLRKCVKVKKEIPINE